MITADDSWQRVVFSLPIAEPPTPVSLGFGVHGVHSPTDRYLLPQLWCLHLYNYRGVLVLNGATLPIRPGYAGITPPGHAVTYHYEDRSTHLFVHFECAPLPVGQVGSQIPAMQDLGDRFPALYASLEEVVRNPTLPTHRRRARLWDLLGQLSTPASTAPTLAGSDTHPTVQKALAQIELGLDSRLSVAAIARNADVSYSYLSRIFQHELGTSVIGYIRKRRIEKATFLLANSTLPIKTIAAAVGLPDLHQFNKTIRASLGYSPRAYRRHYAPSINLSLQSEPSKE